MKTLVLSLGNPLRGDDGIGEAVLNRLMACDLPDDITLLDGGIAGLETVLLMEGYDRVIVIDAADMRTEPGQWRRFMPMQAEIATNRLGGTLHYAGLGDALALGSALGVLPPVIIIYGVQPTEIGWEVGLSDAVQAAVQPVADAILTELQGTHVPIL